jgi:hypothetical protein
MWLALKRLARRLTPKRHRKILLEDFAATLSAEQQEFVQRVRNKSPKPYIATLPYTEHRIEWIILHEHCMRGQMDPSTLRRLRDIDLEYLAAVPHPDWYRVHRQPTSLEEQQRVELQIAKLQANVTRATRELQRRYTIRIGAAIAVLSLVLGSATSRVL